MSQRPRPEYTNKNSTQTLRQGLEEYYALNPNVTDPRELPADFAKILLAHDVAHVVYGCDTDMYDELKILPLGFWTSDFKFTDYICYSHLKKKDRIYLTAIAMQDGKLENVKIRHSGIFVFQLISLAIYASLAISVVSV
jgi:hypothetical protein